MNTIDDLSFLAENTSSLRDLGLTLTILIQPECVVAKCFTNKNIFAYRDSNFDNQEWLPKTLLASSATKVTGYELTDTTTEAEMAKIGRKFTNLLQIEDLILRTEKGENTGLITNGCANIFFLQVVASVFMVLAYRNDDRWNVNLNRFNARNEWNAENRFFSPRNYLFSPAILCGSFSSQERRHRYDIRPTS